MLVHKNGITKDVSETVYLNKFKELGFRPTKENKKSKKAKSEADAEDNGEEDNGEQAE